MGWMGVDFFFVVSGVLITGILIDKKQKENYLKNFYLRRVLKIFPVYCLVVIIVSLLEKYYILSSFNIIYYVLYVQSVVCDIQRWIFIILAHTLFLDIEEQFHMF